MMTVNLEDREKKRKKGRKKERGGSGDVGKKERRKEGRIRGKECERVLRLSTRIE